MVRMETRLDICACPETLEGLGNWVKVFCAGPIRGADPWQLGMPKLDRVMWISPRRWSNNYEEQIDWETEGLRMSDIVLFWIPSPSHHVAGRDYAQTTRTELGEILGRGNKVCVFGCYPEFPGRSYLEYKIKKYWGEHKTLWTSFEQCIEEIRALSHQKLRRSIFFTSDTHFSSQRTLELSRRPFRSVEEMDWTMIERWNTKIGPDDTVYHLGDFGDKFALQYLNGNIKLVLGNHDVKEEFVRQVEIIEPSKVEEKYLVSHEPLYWKNEAGDKLFGHIHGRQTLKEWSGLDVGVDGHNFEPYSEEEVRFYLDSIKKGYYDEEVWS